MYIAIYSACVCCLQHDSMLPNEFFSVHVISVLVSKHKTLNSVIIKSVSVDNSHAQFFVDKTLKTIIHYHTQTLVSQCKRHRRHAYLG